MAADAQPGVRVKVRFAGQDVDGYVVGRADESDHPGRLTPLRRVLSAERVLSPAVAELAGDLAQRYAGVRSDVLRLAVPPRHATTEKEPSDPAPAELAWRAGGSSRGLGTPRPRAGVPPAPARRRRAAGGVERRARRRLAHAARPRRGRDRRGRAGRRDLCPRRQGRRPGRRGADDGPRARPPRGADQRGRPRGALPRLPRRRPRRPADRGRHPQRRLRAGPRPRPGRDLGRRRRPATPSRGRPTPTPARRCCCAPSGRARPLWWAASRAAWRASTCSAPAGPTRSPRRASCCAAG